jgi:hypothetical protein
MDSPIWERMKEGGLARYMLRIALVPAIMVPLFDLAMEGRGGEKLTLLAQQHWRRLLLEFVLFGLGGAIAGWFSWEVHTQMDRERANPTEDEPVKPSKLSFASGIILLVMGLGFPSLLLADHYTTRLVITLWVMGGFFTLVGILSIAVHIRAWREGRHADGYDRPDPESDSE